MIIFARVRCRDDQGSVAVWALLRAYPSQQKVLHSVHVEEAASRVQPIKMPDNNQQLLDAVLGPTLSLFLRVPSVAFDELRLGHRSPGRTGRRLRGGPLCVRRCLMLAIVFVATP
jgi:hypothetical protein